MRVKIAIILSLIFLAFSTFLFFNQSNPYLPETSPTSIATTPTPSFTPVPQTSPNPVHAIKILSLAYYPLSNNKLDTTNVIQDRYGEYPYTLQEVRTKVKRLEQGTIAALEKGQTIVDYQVIEHIEKQEAIPLSNQTHNDLPLPDYIKILTAANVCHFVDEKGVKEIWLWSYAGVGKSGWESNFSGNIDISNSNRDQNDLPRCQNNYTVYDYNYGREVSEAVHDHMHQFEAIFGFIDYHRFWNEFVGREKEIIGCGNTHFPPNATTDYEYGSRQAVKSNCNSWTEKITEKVEEINCSQWDCRDLEYFIWWMKHIPKSWWKYMAEPNIIQSSTQNHLP